MHTAIMEIISRGKTSTSFKRWPLILGLGVCLLAFVLVAAVLITRTDFRSKLNFEKFKPADPAVESQATATAKIFKIPDADQPGTIPGEQLPESGQAPLADNIPDRALKPENSAGEKNEAASAAASESSSVKAFSSSTVHPAPGPDAEIRTQSGQTPISEIINGLEPGSSRKKAVNTILSIWQQPRPNTDIIPSEVDDATFFKIAARQYGLRNYAVQGNWSLVRQLDLPAIIALKKGSSGNPVYLTMVGWRQQTLYLEDGQNNAVIQFDFETVRPYLEGSIYVFWKNFQEDKKEDIL